MELSTSTAYVLLLLIDDPDRNVYLQTISDPVPRQRVHRLRPRLRLSPVRPKYLWWSDDEKSESGLVHNEDDIWKPYYVCLSRLINSLLRDYRLNHCDTES